MENRILKIDLSNRSPPAEEIPDKVIKQHTAADSPIYLKII